MLKWKKDSFQRKVYEGIFLGNRVQVPTFFLHFDVTLPHPQKKEIAMVLPKQRERQQKLLARWLATVLRIQLTGWNDIIV